MISVLMPSRGRSDMARESVKSLGNGDFEVLIWVDEDDPQLAEYLALSAHNIQIYVKPRVGYENFHEMINFLADEAGGEWLMLWNDDARMRTDNWTDILQEELWDEPVVLNFFNPYQGILNLFPVISRTLYEAMGHFSLSTHCDTWVEDIANRLDIHIPVYGITAEHIRESVDDETKSETQAVYAVSSPRYFGPELEAKRCEDIEKIKGLL